MSELSNDELLARLAARINSGKTSEDGKGSPPPTDAGTQPQASGDGPRSDTGPADAGAEAESTIDDVVRRVQQLSRGEEATAVDSQTVKEPQEFIPLPPENLLATRLTESQIEALILKYLLARGEASGAEISDQVALPFRLIENIMSQLKYERCVAHRGSAAMNDYIYVLGDIGRERAKRFQEDSTYFGAAPVALRDYIESVKAQTIEGLEPGPEDLERAFSDLLIDKRIFRKLGPAINSGRGLFLFGPPGNGKTSIAERITEAFGKHVWIPRALEVEGEIIRLFDPINHVEAPLDEGISLMQDVKFDKRWVRIKRPTIVVGGELTMENLEVTYNPTTGISEAPVQLKSNCGTLVIDDFGRQRMAIDELLNRWIVPLEKRYDFLNLASGKKVRVPFDQLVVFSTNLEPKDLVDEAFLRRIPYKIEALNPPEEAFRKLFTIMAPIVGVEYNEEALDHLIKEYYLAVDRPFRNCQPRDLLLQIKNLARFERTEAVMTKDAIDFAVDNYFSVM
ncbi:MAG: AAA family ATPase [Pirellulales bacterium]